MERSFFLKSIAALSVAGLGVPGLAKRAAHSESDVKLLTSDAGYDDWAYLRKHFSFPQGYHYFNTAGIGAVPVRVREQVAKHWDKTETHPKPGHDLSDWTSVKVAVSHSIGVSKPSNIALTNSATEGINILLNGFPWRVGDEIISSTHEHPALHAPLINISQRKGVKLRIFEPDLADGMNNLHRIFNLATSRTRLIFVSLVTCTTGQWLPIEEIVNEAHKRGILVAFDGAQATGSRVLRMTDWDVDFYTSGGQKWLLGPKRTGLFYLKEEHLDLVRPTTVGAYSEHAYDIMNNEISWALDATRYEYATQNESLFFGLKNSVNFLSELAYDEIRDHNEKLAEKLYYSLSEIKNVYLISPDQEEFRTSIISFGLKSMDYRDLAKKLSSAGFRVRVVFEAGLQAVRVSIHVYNSEDEIDALIAKVKALASL